jgi:mRNA interferase MazF
LEKFVKGDVVVVPFPFSDLTRAKKRPALVISRLKGDDLILCQITSQDVRDEYAMPLKEKDFDSGKLRKNSNIRPNRIFTADRHIVLYSVGHLKADKTSLIIEKIIAILRQ